MRRKNPDREGIPTETADSSPFDDPECAAEQHLNGRASVACAGRTDGLAEQIQKLADLRTAGVLSDDEFASAKTRLIGQ
ncbi:SHOCT domain-containing protein [Curtobacterium sp. Leaf183]|uniref:SHOCT domain-containing protein n=1 Tax=Curtobacterium sp. Leaf183 TaxID=1736291 RepID=UPI0012E75B78